MNTNPSKQRQQFYRDYASGQWSMSELCDRYQTSRLTHLIMLGNRRGAAADAKQHSPIDSWYSLAASAPGPALTVSAVFRGSAPIRWAHPELSEFEFLSVLISIIFGLALTHVLSGAVRSVYAGFSTETHLVYAAFFIQVLLLNWWVFFKWNTASDWSFDRFLILTLWAMTHYVMAVSVYPPGQSEIDDGRRSCWFLWAFIATVLADIAITSIRGDLFQPWFYLPYVLHYIVLSLIAIIVNTPTIHRFTSWWFLSVTVVWALVVRRLLS